MAVCTFFISSIGVGTSFRRCKYEFQVVTEELFQASAQSPGILLLLKFSITVLVVSAAVMTPMLPIQRGNLKETYVESVCYKNVLGKYFLKL
jgi:hypothetical protein